MKVLFVTPYYKPYLGGIERVVEKLGREFLNHPQIEDVGVLTTKWVFPSNPRDPREYREDLPEHERIDNLEVFRIGSFPKVAPPFYQVPLVWFSPLEIKQVINNFNPDVIQIMSDRWFWGNFWAWVWARQGRTLAHSRQISFSLSFHELAYGQQASLPLWLLKQLLRPINAFLTRRVNWVHAITRHERNLVQKTYWTPQKRFELIPWGVQIPTNLAFRNRGRERQTLKTPLKLLAVGRISEHKGQLWLVERYLEAEFNQPTELILVGKTNDRSYLQKIQDLRFKIQEGSDKEITVAGEVSDEELSNYYRTSNLFALFPEYEAFGLVFLEAMSYRIPVITHNVGAIREVLKEGALITPAYDAPAAARALEELVNKDEKRLHLGKKAQRYVLENFSWQKTAASFIRQYQA